MPDPNVWPEDAPPAAPKPIFEGCPKPVLWPNGLAPPPRVDAWPNEVGPGAGEPNPAAGGAEDIPNTDGSS